MQKQRVKTSILGLSFNKAALIALAIFSVKYSSLVRVSFDRLESVFLFKESINLGK